MDRIKKFNTNIKKVLRYVRLYGLSRTVYKILGQKHNKSKDIFTGDVWINLNCKTQNTPERAVAIIGCGYFAYANIAYYLKKENKLFLRGAMDIDRAKARSLCDHYGGAYATTDLDRILNDKYIKIVYISSNHSTHADYAIKCIEAGKHVHIEKPHVVSWEQLNKLEYSINANKGVMVFLGFNRPRSYLFKKLLHCLNTQSGALMINWFVVGHYLDPNHWYYNDQEGGRVLGNLSHWTDATLHIVGNNNAFPCQIIPSIPAGAKSDYVVTINFNDNSSAVISFSAKGWVSSGVIEVLNLQKGDLVATIHKFDHLSIDSKDYKKTWKPWFRDQGHRANLLNSYNSAISDKGKGESTEYIKNTARLFLGIRDSIELGNTISLD
ncbi:Gfo/Idh/MocA family oxidoreductase [bacterium]|nr:Gfo/Idh/MocA family oxidoreductase [bacterium]